MIKENILYRTVIENDGRLGTEPTILGVILLAVAAFVAVGVIIVLGSFL